MKKITISFISILCYTILFSCSQSEPILKEQIPEKYEYSLSSISKSPNVNINDINSYLKDHKPVTKSGEQKKIKELFPLLSDAGDTLMYVVNYSDNKGYTIYSATRNYNPIIAYSDEGNYSPSDDATSVMELLLEEAKNVISFQKKTPDSTIVHKNALAWLKYSSKIKITETKSLASVAMSYFPLWKSEYDDVFSLEDFLNNSSFSSSIREELDNRSYSSVSPSIDRLKYCFVLVKEVSNKQNYGTFITTRWHQKAPFNNKLEYKTGLSERVTAGCGNIALGQVMAFHRYPTKFNWDGILSLQTDYISDFIKEIYLANNTSSNYITGASSTYMSSLFNTLINYGYSSDVKLSGYDENIISNESLNNRPVILSGQTANSIGHAWVCDGYQIESKYYEIVLKVPAGNSYVTKYSTRTSDPLKMFHMNWGWTVSNTSGWFLMDTDPAGYCFKDEKQLIYNIKH